MKKLILLLIVGSLLAQDVDTSGMSDLEKQMLFKQNDKAVWLTRINAGIMPTLGHAYVGNWGRGFQPIIASTSVAASLLITFISGSQIVAHFGEAGYNYDYYGYDSEKDWKKSKKYKSSEKHSIIYPIGVIALATTSIFWYYLQMQDAVYLAKQHNADLYKQIYGRDYPIPPKKSFVQKMIDKKEAKKGN